VSDNDLKSLERRTFRTITDDGLWDVLLALVFALFAVAPMLSQVLGDFWSAAVFLPIWLAAYLIVRFVRRRIVIPRVGTVRFGSERRQRLHRFALVMLGVNAAAALLGLIVTAGVQMNWLEFGSDPGNIGYPVILAIVILAGFTAAAYMLNIPRYYLYGLMLAIAPVIGEWLWRNDLAAHHGYPIAFGVASAVMFVAGITRFGVHLRQHPPPTTR
jgi:hypothetical protein